MATLNLTKNGLDLTKEPIAPEPVEESPAKSVKTEESPKVTKTTKSTKKK